MKAYFEFFQQDYYGLVTINVKPDSYVVDEAAQVYVEIIGGNSVEEILEEGEPRQVTMEYAFWKLANCDDSKKYSVEELLKQFDELENTCVVIDRSLV